MYKIFLEIILVIIIVFSISAGVKKPLLHNVVQIYDSSYVVIKDNTKQDNIKLSKKEEVIYPIQEKKIEDTKTVKKVQEIPTPTVIKDTKTTKVDTSLNKTTKALSSKPQNTITTTVSTSVPKETKNKTSPTVQKSQASASETKTPEQLEQEELIAWNIWHSNIQNKLMQDVKLPTMPDGIIFKFSFNVDKYGKITNINTYSTNPKYTPYAIEFIAPVIKSYQGKSILNFPKNSKRTTTEFKGGWKMSSVTKYSNPSDYNDIEKIKK